MVKTVDFFTNLLYNTYVQLSRSSSDVAEKFQSIEISICSKSRRQTSILGYVN